MHFKITTLVDNTAPIMSGRKLIGEHGLAFLIETPDQKILFDTGQYMALENNARVLGVDLSEVDTVILSHGHYDHTGGLKHLLECNSHFSLYAHPHVFERKLIKRNDRYREIGIPVSKNDLVKSGVKLILDAKSVEIAPGIITTGEIPQDVDFESVAPGFFIEKDGRKVPDSLVDDLALILMTGTGPVVVLGCSHRGIINTLRQVEKLTGKKHIRAILGGLHLVKATGQNLEVIAAQLRRYNLEKMVVGHCTGNPAVLALSQQFKGKVLLNTVGNKMTF